ncbi:hypothetical protein CHS0354_008682 [Potamilus streckersoni]|uniref:Uncharacterized protein n=1 Tax=Potamilus streckersoni TaxID=2493646 RepID=A0AAE0WE93_9BIVA|nr:hypothetical protein CHS0354_008682 [Potamilus streckersoni]
MTQVRIVLEALLGRRITDITLAQKVSTAKVSSDRTWLLKSKDKFSSITEWASRWKGLPQEKKRYVYEARQIPKGAVCEEPKKARCFLLKKLDDLKSTWPDGRHFPKSNWPV